MRTIKFRGKQKNTEEWLLGSLICLTIQGEQSPFITQIKHKGDKLEEINYIQVIPSSVGQFTGLQDSNGNDIYEGDILKDKDWEVFEDKKSFVVSFDEISPRFLCERTDGGGSNFQLDATFAKRSVIIANIHDNPELLKGGEKWIED